MSTTEAAWLGIALASLATAALLGASRGRRAVYAFGALFAPQLTIAAWAVTDLLAWRDPRADIAATGLLVGIADLLVHRLPHTSGVSRRASPSPRVSSEIF